MSSPPKPLQKQNTHKKITAVTTAILAVFVGSVGFIYEYGMEK